MGATEVRSGCWMVGLDGWKKMGNGSGIEHGKKRHSRWKVISLSLSLSVFHVLGWIICDSTDHASMEFYSFTLWQQCCCESIKFPSSKVPIFHIVNLNISDFPALILPVPSMICITSTWGVNACRRLAHGSSCANQSEIQFLEEKSPKIPRSHEMNRI